MRMHSRIGVSKGIRWCQVPGFSLGSTGQLSDRCQRLLVNLWCSVCFCVPAGAYKAWSPLVLAEKCAIQLFILWNSLYMSRNRAFVVAIVKAFSLLGFCPQTHPTADKLMHLVRCSIVTEARLYVRDPSSTRSPVKFVAVVSVLWHARYNVLGVSRSKSGGSRTIICFTKQCLWTFGGLSIFAASPNLESRIIGI